MTTDSAPGALLFEVAWEVCNKIGGIYTVLRTKAQTARAEWGDSYFLLGPYNHHTAALEFEEDLSPPKDVLMILGELNARGIACHYGTWLIQGQPRVFLFDIHSLRDKVDFCKYLLWEHYGIHSHGNHEINDPVCLGAAILNFFEIATKVWTDKQLLAHFHEWMAGVGLLMLHAETLPVKTVFTTHATILGRHVAGNDPDFYDRLLEIHPESTAQSYNIGPLHAIESHAAQSATIFSTVSEVTKGEAWHFLGRNPEFVLPNGLNAHKFTALHEFQNLHLTYKEQIHEFVSGHFFPSYTFDLDNTLYFFTSGRYEYRNKGMDVFIESLYYLNQRLLQERNAPTVVAFIITKGSTYHINADVLQRQLMFREIKENCAKISSAMEKTLTQAASHGRIPDRDDLLPPAIQASLKRSMLSFKQGGLPAIVTHDMVHQDDDAVLRHLRHRNLINHPFDKVKVIFHPDFITSGNPLLGLDYDHFVRGCHLGIFPSSYEPWGYTPLECIALGLPAITTDLSGFGAYVDAHLSFDKFPEIFVLNRRSRPIDQAIHELVDHLHSFTTLQRRERIELRNRAERHTLQFDWQSLYDHYSQAYDAALDAEHVSQNSIEA